MSETNRTEDISEKDSQSQEFQDQFIVPESLKGTTLVLREALNTIVHCMSKAVDQFNEYMKQMNSCKDIEDIESNESIEDFDDQEISDKNEPEEYDDEDYEEI